MITNDPKHSQEKLFCRAGQAKLVEKTVLAPTGEGFAPFPGIAAEKEFLPFAGRIA